MKEQITIRTKSGKLIERNATVTQWINDRGSPFAAAQVGKTTYRVIDRGYDGAIFGV